jgi:hypothetical protein
VEELAQQHPARYGRGLRRLDFRHDRYRVRGRGEGEKGRRGIRG